VYLFKPFIALEVIPTLLLTRTKEERKTQQPKMPRSPVFNTKKKVEKQEPEVSHLLMIRIIIVVK